MDMLDLDFQKAFSKVPYRKLAHGIEGRGMPWVENWLWEG